MHMIVSERSRSSTAPLKLFQRPIFEYWSRKRDIFSYSKLLVLSVVFGVVDYAIKAGLSIIILSLHLSQKNFRTSSIL